MHLLYLFYALGPQRVLGTLRRAGPGSKGSPHRVPGPPQGAKDPLGFQSIEKVYQKYAKSENFVYCLCICCILVVYFCFSCGIWFAYILFTFGICLIYVGVFQNDVFGKCWLDFPNDRAKPYT